MRCFVLTDLEGVAGIDSFARTRTDDEQQKAPAMDQLAREVNACVRGIHTVAPDARVDVWDGHGSGGLREADLRDATFIGEGRPYFDLEGYDAVLFVGQHAMAGTVDAPLRHTYSSRSVAYYRLDGTFVGEFGCRALVAGLQGVPTVFLSGDDKAVHEAEMFVPEIETVATKRGTGEESAVHEDGDASAEAIEEGTVRALDRIDKIPPYTGFEPPYTLEIRYDNPIEEPWWREGEVERIDERTIRIHGDDLIDPKKELRRVL